MIAASCSSGTRSPPNSTLSPELRQEIDAHRPRAEDHQHDMLHQVGDREGGDQQGRRVRLAQRAEGDALHAQREDATTTISAASPMTR